jgi:AbrB family looped-hinge helix DNA binding protein
VDGEIVSENMSGKNMSGFADRDQAGLTGQPLAQRAGKTDADDAALTLRATVKLGPGGRIVIPADMRDAMGLKPGDGILLSYEEGAMRLVTLAETVRQLQDMTNQYVPEGVSLVDGFIAERRAAAAKE